MFFFILFKLLHCVFNDFAQNTVNYNGKYKTSIKSSKFPVTFATLLKSSALGCFEVSRSRHLEQAGEHAGREDARERERERERGLPVGIPLRYIIPKALSKDFNRKAI